MKAPDPKRGDEAVALALTTHGLTKRFGDFVAVDHVSMQVRTGEVVGYLGPNGSGKTTTIRMLLGLLHATEGEGTLLGYDIRTETEKVRQHVGYMSQRFALYGELSVEENLAFYAGVYGKTGAARLEETLHLVGLQTATDARVSELPMGWRQRLALAVALVHRPAFVFLDEPTSGVDPVSRREFWDTIYDLVDMGMTAFVTTHHIDEAEYCQRVGIMHHGQLLAMDSPAELKRSRLRGQAWEVHADPLLSALDALQQMPFVSRAVLASDHLRAITAVDVDSHRLIQALTQAGLQGVRVKAVEASLEDVFLSLAGA
jgi:ABC-2 type transport system ATP-binding protein